MLAYSALKRASTGLLVVSLLAVGGCSTNTVFDYGIPSRPVNPKTKQPMVPGSFADIEDIANHEANQYAARASNIASTSQVFDLAALGGAIATVFGVIFRASVHEIEALAAGTAGAAAVGSYYSPRTRATLYSNGAQAMNCVATLSSEADKLFPNDANTTIERAYASATPTNQLILQPVLDFPQHGVLLLSAAIGSIDARVLSSAMSASAAPDLSALRTTLMSQIQNAVTNRAAFTSALHAKSAAGVSSELLPSETDKAAIQPQVDFVADFDAAVTTCIAKAG